MKKLIFLIVLVTIFQYSYSQSLHVGVLDKNTSEPLIGATIKVLDSNIGGITDHTGHVMFNDLTFPMRMEISYVGYKTDTIQFLEQVSGMKMFGLLPDGDLDAVVIEGEQMATDVDPLSAQHVELMSSKELLKAACCNLSESFENSATVDVSYSDAVTGSKQISMLGLAGVYTQINWENMPLVRGLGEYYGLSFVPGTWVESIQVTKGAGSVINGYESMTGQINVEFFKPDNIDKLYLNAYQNLQGRTELNSHAGIKLNDKWSTALFIHGNIITGEPDGNEDSFIDRNKGNQINLMNRWKYAGKGNLRSQFGVKYLQDQKVGGQVGFDKGDTYETAGLYGVDVQSDRLEVFAKNGFIFPEQPWKSIGIIANATSHNQEALFGLDRLSSDQKSLYGNLIYQTIIGDTRHKVKTGANFQYDNFSDNLNNQLVDREYVVPGLFGEYDFDNLNNIKVITGLRADYLNTTDKIEISPRIHFKWTTDGENAIRLSAGRGFRAPNLYADSPAMLVSNREVVIEDQPEIESSWNMGASITRYFQFKERDGTFVADFYRTAFENQLIRDFYSSKDHIYISNLDGKSYSNSFQASLDYELFDRFDMRLAYKIDDVKQDIRGKRIERQLVPKNRALINLGYATNYDRWKFDVTAQYTGEQRLPSTAETPFGFTQAHFSDDFWRFNGQVTTKFRGFEFYLGGENLGNFRQENPIIGAENPFGNDFDASSVWGPIQGTNVYAGFRFRIKQKEE